MKASEVINKLQDMIDQYGDKDVRVVGTFVGGTHEFDIFDEAQYYESCNILGCEFAGVPEGSFLIDDVCD